MIGNDDKITFNFFTSDLRKDFLVELSIGNDDILIIAFPFFFFLVADTQLYKRLCPSVYPSVRLSVVIKL